MQFFKTEFCAEHYTNTETILDPLFRLYFPSANVQESPQRIRSKSASCLSLISEDVLDMCVL